MTIGQEAQWTFPTDPHAFLRRHDEGDWHLCQWSLRKFEQDKLWLDTPEAFLAVEGVLFNREAIAAHPDMPVTDWRGSFAAVRYDKASQTCAVYNDQIGSHMLFWCRTDRTVWVASDLFELSRLSGLRQPNSDYMQAILQHGYGADDSTIITGIRRICAGCYLHIHNGQAEVRRYHRFANLPHPDSREWLETTNRLFRQAVQRVLDKNREYDLQNLFPLSGGLDSRMVEIVAHQLTDRPISNFTYSQTGHYDHLLPRQIADYLGNPWQFLPLDGGDYLSSIDAITRATQALINYNGPSEIFYCSQSIDFSGAGMVATGVNGDNIFSVETDARHEIDRLYSLSFAGNGLGSPLVLQAQTETYSPFCDVDVLDYVLRIPLRQRWNYRFYDRWILRFYPEATQWLHKGERIGHRRIVVPILGRNIALRQLPKRMGAWLLKHLHIYNAYRQTKEQSMNPYDYWWQTNPQLREAMQQSYRERIALLQPYPAILRLAQQYWQKGNTYDRCAVLTILSAIDQLR